YSRDLCCDKGCCGPITAPDSCFPAILVERQVVLVVKDEGCFEPRPIRLGRRGNGYREVLDGLKASEYVLTSATFLIDAESNLRAALRAFVQPESKSSLFSLSTSRSRTFSPQNPISRSKLAICIHC